MAIGAQVPAARSVPGPGLIRSLISMAKTWTAPSSLDGSYTAFVVVVTARADTTTQVRAGSELEWMLARRYSAFRRMHQRLSTKFATLPPLPPPRPLLNTDPVFVEGRRAALEHYLTGLLAQKAVVCSEEVQQFLQLQEHGVSLRNPFKLMATTVLTDQVFAIRALIYADDVVITGCEDTAMFKRLDSLLTNTRFPWEKQGSIVPIGCINIWSQKESSEWVVSASAYFPSPVTSIAYNRRHRQVFTALSSGLVQVHSLNNSYSLLSECQSLNVHRKKIIQAHHLDHSRMLVTCSFDNTIAMTDTFASLHVARSLLSTPMLSFEVTTDERWLIGGTASCVYVVDLSENQLRIVRQISDQIAGPIMALHFCPEQKALLTSQDRICCIYSLSKPDLSIFYIQLINRRCRAAYRPVAELHEGPTSPICHIAFSAPSSQILTAHRNGCIAVWDATGAGSLKYVVGAHDSGITALQWIASDRLISSSLDGRVKFWNLPFDEDSVMLTSVSKMVLRSQRTGTPPDVTTESRSSIGNDSSRSSSPESLEMS